MISKTLGWVSFPGSMTREITTIEVAWNALRALEAKSPLCCGDSLRNQFNRILGVAVGCDIDDLEILRKRGLVQRVTVQGKTYELTEQGREVLKALNLIAVSMGRQS